MQSQYESPGHLPQITPRERQALQLLADGDTPRQVSIGLAISAAETEALLERLFAAMGAATRDEVCSRENGFRVSANAYAISDLPHHNDHAVSFRQPRSENVAARQAQRIREIERIVPIRSAPPHYGTQVEAQLLHGWPALLDHDGYRSCIVAQMPAGKSRDLVEQAAQHAVSIRRAMSNDRFQKAIVPELEAL